MSNLSTTHEHAFCMQMEPHGAVCEAPNYAADTLVLSSNKLIDIILTKKERASRRKFRY